MTAAVPHSQFDGLCCRRCGYSLRGLPHLVCPECGADEPVRASCRVHPVAGLLGGLLSLLSGSVVSLWCVRLHSIYVDELYPGWCLSGVHAIRHYFVTRLPLWLLLPALGWVLAAWAHRQVPLARVCTIAAAVCWLTVLVLIRYGHLVL